jgi:hypothetical protein
MNRASREDGSIFYIRSEEAVHAEVSSKPMPEVLAPYKMYHASAELNTEQLDNV